MRAVGGVPDDLILTTEGFAAGVKRTSVRFAAGVKRTSVGFTGCLVVTKVVFPVVFMLTIAGFAGCVMLRGSTLGLLGKLKQKCRFKF